jgi:hypothetical protein
MAERGDEARLRQFLQENPELDSDAEVIAAVRKMKAGGRRGR